MGGMGLPGHCQVDISSILSFFLIAIASVWMIACNYISGSKHCNVFCFTNTTIIYDTPSITKLFFSSHDDFKNCYTIVTTTFSFTTTSTLMMTCALTTTCTLLTTHPSYSPSHQLLGTTSDHLKIS